MALEQVSTHISSLVRQFEGVKAELNETRERVTISHCYSAIFTGVSLALCNAVLLLNYASILRLNKFLIIISKLLYQLVILLTPSI